MAFRPILATSALWCLSLSCTGPYSQQTVTAKADARVPVRVRQTALENIAEIVSATGELLAEDQATLRAKVAGRVSAIKVDLGSRAEQGDVVVELEKDDYLLRLKQAEAAVEQTRARLGLGPNDGDAVDPEKTALVRQAAASLKEARLMQANAAQLFKQGVVSNVDFQRAGVNLQAAEARHQGAIEEIYRTRAELLQRQQELALSRQQLADTVIRAPFRGAVTQRIATLGEYLAINAPAVVLVRWHPLRVRLQVPERQAFRVRAGQRIDITFEGQLVPRPGRVVRLSPAIEAQNRSLIIEGEMPNEDGRLRAGAFVEATITVNPNASGIAVNRASIINFAGVDRAFVVKDGKLAERIVRMGRRLEGDRIEIASGLEEGAALVVNPTDRFVPGQPVTVER